VVFVAHGSERFRKRSTCRACSDLEDPVLHSPIGTGSYRVKQSVRFLLQFQQLALQLFQELRIVVPHRFLCDLNREGNAFNCARNEAARRAALHLVPLIELRTLSLGFASFWQE